MKPKIDIKKPITVTASTLGPDYIELNLSMTDGVDIKIPMLIQTAKGIGVTLTTIADRLSARRGKGVIEYEIKEQDLN
jgi:hypothetical protein